MSNISESCYLDFQSPTPYDRYLFPFERNFDYWGAYFWFVRNWWLCFYIIGVYLLAIVAGKRFMKSKPAYDLRLPVILWNVFLALYSISATVRLFPDFMMAFQQQGFHSTLCATGSTERRVAAGFWGHLFVVFKVVELGDTAFIVLRKKPLIFLHWFHHATVVFFSWVAGAYPSAIGQHFLMANIVMHAFVYSYYALKAMRVKIPRSVNIAITSMQILEMAFGVFVTWSAYRVKAQNPDCCVFDEYIGIAATIYASYLVLFINFFIKSYIRNDGELFDEKGVIKKME